MVDFFAPLTQQWNPSGMTAMERNWNGSIFNSETAVRGADESRLLSQALDERPPDLSRL